MLADETFEGFCNLKASPCRSRVRPVHRSLRRHAALSLHLRRRLFYKSEAKHVVKVNPVPFIGGYKLRSLQMFLPLPAEAEKLSFLPALSIAARCSCVKFIRHPFPLRTMPQFGALDRKRAKTFLSVPPYEKPQLRTILQYLHASRLTDDGLDIAFQAFRAPTPSCKRVRNYFYKVDEGFCVSIACQSFCPKDTRRSTRFFSSVETWLWIPNTSSLSVHKAL